MNDAKYIGSCIGCHRVRRHVGIAAVCPGIIVAPAVPLDVAVKSCPAPLSVTV